MTRNYSYQRQSRNEVNRLRIKKSNARFKQTFESGFCSLNSLQAPHIRLHLMRKPLLDNRIETTVQLGRVNGVLKDFSAFSDALPFGACIDLESRRTSIHDSIIVAAMPN